MADLKELRRAYAEKALKICANKDGTDYNKPSSTIIFGGVVISMCFSLGTLLFHSEDGLPDKTGSDNRSVVHEAFQKTTQTLVSLHTQLDQGANARGNTATMETLKRLNMLGTEIPDHIESSAQDAAKQQTLDSELPKFLEALALDSDLTETDKDNFLKDLAKSGISLENTIAAEYNAGAFDECRVKYDNAADIYACSPDEAQDIQKGGMDTVFIGVGFTILFTFLMLTTNPPALRKYAKHHGMNH